MFNFLATKIGLSLVFAVIIIGGATAFKFKSDKNDDLSQKVDKLADASVEKVLENSLLDNPDWEDTLKNLSNGTTTDEIVKSLEERASATSTPETELTATDRFAREFLTQYVKLKNSGAEIDESTGINLVNKLLANDYGGPAGEPVYTAQNINILKTPTLADIKKYGNTMGTILDEPIPDDYENELVIINRVYETENNEELQKLALNIARYEKIRKNMLSIYVPNALTNAHLSFINSLSAMIEGVRGMSLISTDPVGATKMILRYEEGLKSLEVTSEAISSYFKKQNVTFSSTESGYIWVK